MDTLNTLLFVIQVLVAVALIGIILIQQGKGADAGAAFGSGSSSTVFGSQGSGGFMSKTTSILAAVFLANSLFLGYLASQNVQTQPTSLLDTIATEQEAADMDMPAMTEPADSDIPALPEQ